MEDNTASVVTEAFDIAQRYLTPSITEVEEPGTGVIGKAIIGASGVKELPESIFDAFREKPKRRIENATLFDLDSFIAYTNRFKDTSSALFADSDRDAPSLLAVIDYHHSGAIGSVDPRWCNHTAHFKFPLSDQWKKWTEYDSQSMSMDDFSAFLEDNIIDVLSGEFVSFPDGDDETRRFFEMMGGKQALADPARLMEIANNLSINESSVVSQANRLSSGEATIEFRSEHEASTNQSGKITVPKMFAIALPVFKGGEPYRVFARLRYRKSGPSITFWYELWRPDRTFDHAFSESIEKAKEKTELPAFLGKYRG